MKKDSIFTTILCLVGAALCLLKWTGITAHIIVSVVGVLTLVAYTVLTRKEWKIPALEIALRAFYGIALITGIIVMNVSGVLALAIIHKLASLLYLVALVALIITKEVANKKV